MPIRSVRLIYDQNLPSSLTFRLRDLFPGSVHVRDLELASSPDSAIWDHAGASGFAIMTKDKDFAERARREGPPPTVIQIRLGNCPVVKLEAVVRDNAGWIATAVSSGEELVEIGTGSAPAGNPI